MGILAALAFALSALLFQPQPPQPQPEASPPNDVTCSLASISVISRVVPGSKEPPHSYISAALQLRGAEGVKAAARNAIVTEVLDEKGRNILVKQDRDEVHPDETRRELCYDLCNTLNAANNESTCGAYADLSAVPGAISSFSGEFDAFIARSIVRKKIELKVSEEPIELVPGLTFLLTSVEPGDNTTKISFEVHTKRRRDKAGGEPGLEPVFAGLIAMHADGTPAQTFDNGSDFDTRDEHIMILKDMSISTQDIAGWQIWALDKIERVRLTFGTKQLKVAEDGR